MDAAHSRQFRRTQISMGDFLTAIRFLKTARVHAISSTEHETLLMAAVICYARRFTGNEKAAGARATSRLALPTPKGEDGKLHRRIIRARNKAVAHAESSHYRVDYVPPFISSSGGVRAPKFATRVIRWHPLNEHFDLNAFERIAEFMMRQSMNEQANVSILGLLPKKPRRRPKRHK